MERATLVHFSICYCAVQVKLVPDVSLTVSVGDIITTFVYVTFAVFVLMTQNVIIKLCDTG